MKKSFKSNQGQSTLEYIILVAAVIAVMVFLLTGDNSPFRTAVNDTYQGVFDGMVDRGDNLTAQWADEE